MELKLFTSSESFDGDNPTNPTIPSQFRILKQGPIVISKHAVICANTVIMPNVTIGEGSIIGVQSIVTKSVAPWGIYQGIPLRRLKSRNKAKYLKMENNLITYQENDFLILHFRNFVLVYDIHNWNFFIPTR